MRAMLIARVETSLDVNLSFLEELIKRRYGVSLHSQVVDLMKV